jgi:hypothetical protein
MHGTIIVTLSSTRTVETGPDDCGTNSFGFFNRYVWLNFFVMTIGLLSIILNAKHFLTRSNHVYNSAFEMGVYFSQIRFVDLLSFFNLWLIFGTFGNVT